jgi:hypothetical protein
MVRIGIWRMRAKYTSYSPLKVFQCDRISRLIEDERDALLRVNRTDEEVAGLCDLDVLAKAYAKC